jgi:predicted deacetylase
MKMMPEYFIRFDDICPTMDWLKWEPVERALIAARVKPLLSVVPDNRDPELQAAPAHPEFWQKVREWQTLGWSIGLHGFQHRYESTSAGMLGRNGRSEFAGLTEPVQREKLQRGLEIFEREGVRAEAFIAPGHSFDQVTVRLLSRLGVNCISDGYALYPYVSGEGMLWVPQQLGWFRKMPFGLWTVCLHVNPWSPRRIERFREDLSAFRESTISLDDIRSRYGHRSRTLSDQLFHNCYRVVRNLKARVTTEVPCTSLLP